MRDEQFEEARRRMCAALADRTLTMGASVAWKTMHVIGGNLEYDDPALSPVYIDELGRIWKERHHGDEHALICVLDIRTLAAAIDAPPHEEGEDVLGERGRGD